MTMKTENLRRCCEQHLECVDQLVTEEKGSAEPGSRISERQYCCLCGKELTRQSGVWMERYSFGSTMGDQLAEAVKNLGAEIDYKEQ